MLAVFVAVVVVAVVTLGSAAAWLWHSPSALGILAERVPGLAISGQQGRPGGGPFALRRLQWQGGSLRVVIEGLAWDDAQWAWRPHPGAWVGLRLTQPRALRVQLSTGLAPPPAPPAAAPSSLRLPFELHAPGLRINRLEIDRQPAVTALAADLHLGAAAGAEHRMQHLALMWNGLTARGQAVLGTAAGLPLQAQLDVSVPAYVSAAAASAPAAATASAPAAAPTTPSVSAAWRAEVQLQGPLARLPVQARFSHSSGASASAQATLAPFAAWPLVALAAQASRLDLSTLAPGLPQTALSGRATLADPLAQQTLQDPLALEVELENAAPGPWNARRLPLQRLQVSLLGHPSLAQPLRFKQFFADLAGPHPAGRVEGSGQFHKGELTLALTLTDLHPEQLFSGAAPMRLAGQLNLRASSAVSAVAAPAAASAAASTASSTASATASATGAAPAGAAPRALQATMQVDLNARLPQPSSPQLTLQTTAAFTQRPDGTLIASLRSLQARALPVAGATAGRNRNLGNATGEATAQRNTAGDWQLQTRGALAAFDPGPWWPSARVGRGAQALNARWQADLTRLASTAGPASGAVPPSASKTAPALPQRPAFISLPLLRGSARVDLQNSRYAGLDWRGQLSLQATAPALQAQAELHAGANRLQLNGQWPHAQGRAAAVPTGTLDLQRRRWARWPVWPRCCPPKPPRGGRAQAA